MRWIVTGGAGFIGSHLVRTALAEGRLLVAAESHADRPIEAAHGFARTNVLGTQVLLDAARAHGVGRFLYDERTCGSRARAGAPPSPPEAPVLVPAR